MPVTTEPKTLADVLFWEVDRNYSRETVTIAAGRRLPIGTVLGKIGASGLFVGLDPAATDDSQVAVALLLADVDAVADTPAPVAARACILKRSGLVWPTAITPEQQAAAEIQLRYSAGAIVIRDAA